MARPRAEPAGSAGLPPARESARIYPAGAPGEPWWVRTPWPALLLGALCYLNTLTHGFVYDDVTLVQNNPRIQSLAALREIWLTEWWDPGESVHITPFLDRLYRPLTLFTFALNYAVHGVSPFGYHLVNLLLHAAASGLVWQFVRRLSASTAAAGVAALLFAVHPVHVEAVAGIVGRAEIISALFLMAGLLCLRPPAGARPGWGRVAAAAGLFLGALLAKETAICYPVVAGLMLIHAGGGRAAGAAATAGLVRLPLWRWLCLWAILLAPLLVYFPLRAEALGGQLLRKHPPPVLMNPLRAAAPDEHVWGVFTVFGHYARLLVVPADLSSDYGFAIIDPSVAPEPLTWLGLAAALLLLAAAALPWRSRSATLRLVALLAAMFLASYVLISNSVLLIGVAVAERLMYWPSVLYCAAVGVVLVGVWRRHASPEGALGRLTVWLPWLGLAVLIALALRTTTRNLDWRGNLELFRADVARWPNGVRLNEAYANELLRTITLEMDPAEAAAVVRTAEEHLLRAQRLYSSSPAGLLLYAKVRVLQGDLAHARRLLERAVQIAPHGTLARHALALLNQPTDESLEQRIAVLEAQLQDRPDDVENLRTLAELLLASGRWPAARQRFERLTELTPDDPAAWIRLGEIHVVLLEPQRARAAFETVLRSAPDHWEAHANLAVVLSELDPPACLRHAEQALRLRPDDLRVQLNYAEALVLNRRVSEARTLLRRLDAELPAAEPLRSLVRERLVSLGS